MNKKLKLVLLGAFLLAICYGAYSFFINLNKATAPSTSSAVTYLVSSVDSEKYFNGVDMDSVGYQKTITVKKASSTTEINPTRLQIIKTVIDVSTTHN